MPLEKARILLLAGTETRFHRADEVVPPLMEVVEAWGGVVNLGVGALALTEANLTCCDAILSITSGGILSAKQESALLSALLSAIATPSNDRGKAVHFIGLHGASCSFEHSDAYLDMLGGRFVSHPPLRPFSLSVDDPTHPLTRGIDAGPFSDEQYLLEPRAEFSTLLSSVHDDLRTPCLWHKKHGHGKVVYCALGHGEEQLRHPVLRRVVENALDWCLNEADASHGEETD